MPVPTAHQADVLVIGWGLAGLVAATEAAAAGKSVIVVDQEPRPNLGGQAFWSFGGLLFVDSPEQRRMGIRDSLDLARQDWFATAGFDREEDHWPRQWAEAYLDFAHGEKRAWLREKGVGFFPVVGWAERGGYTATGPGNSVPRFHITWGTGPGLVAPFQAALERGEAEGRITVLPRHKVTGLTTDGGTVTGATGDVLAPSGAARGVATSREVVDSFEIVAGATIVASGGIGGNHDLVRAQWPARLGTPPDTMISGVPAFVDGSMQPVSAAAGARLINGDRMWHYVEGIQNWNPIWPQHGIRILPGPSSVWLDATGARLPVPLFPGFDTLGTLAHLRATGHDHSWFVLSHQIVEKEFTLSGSEQNPDLTGKDVRLLVTSRLGKGAAGPVQAFLDHGADFVVRPTLDELIAGMQALPGGDVLDGDLVRREVEARDREMDNDFTKDAQVAMLRSARSYRGDKLVRTAKPHRILDPKAGPLIAVKLHVL
ncbi:MAG TPA: FAD-binding dehydrogenase, partial [Microbacterium sp.]|nr:FAD-binding dehydrogenase [Microbacterium sp.]